MGCMANAPRRVGHIGRVGTGLTVPKVIRLRVIRPIPCQKGEGYYILALLRVQITEKVEDAAN